MNRNQPVITDLGIIEGRDGIYLDNLKQGFSPSKLTLIGEINGNLCTGNNLNHQWYAYEVSFNNIKAYESLWIDICKWEMISSFDKINDSILIEELGLKNKGLHHYLFSTYDYIYNIIAKDFEFKITGKR